MTPPLDGLLVADFSRALAGPLATMTLADLGADVVKVEHPAGGDETRSWGPPFVDGESAYFLAVNRNKRSVIMDLATPAGADAAHELARRADVLVENFRPGVAERLGLGYDDLRQVNERLVYASVSGFGREGRGASLPGYDFMVQAIGGLMSVTGARDGEPMKAGAPIVDVLAGLNLQSAILAALLARQHSGLGQRVDVDLMSALLSGLANHSSSWLTAGHVARATGNRHPSIAPYETLTAGDGPLAVAVGNNGQFVRLCAVIGVPELVNDDRFAHNASRVEHRDELIDVLEGALQGRSAASWAAELQDAGVPAAVVNTIEGAFVTARRLGMKPDVSLRRDDGTAVRQIASPLHLGASPVSYRLAPPRLGQHTDEVLAWLARPG